MKIVGVQSGARTQGSTSNKGGGGGSGSASTAGCAAFALSVIMRIQKCRLGTFLNGYLAFLTNRWLFELKAGEHVGRGSSPRPNTYRFHGAIVKCLFKRPFQV